MFMNTHTIITTKRNKRMNNNYYRPRKKRVYDEKDEADLFREQSLRAIRRRELWSKYMFGGMTILAITVFSFAIYVCLFEV